MVTAAISAINSDVFGAGRMLYGMANRGQAPRIFQKLSRNGVLDDCCGYGWRTVNWRRAELPDS